MASKSEVALAKRKQAAVLRAQRRLENRLADLQWEHDVLNPAMDQLDKAAAQGVVIDTTLVELEDGEDEDAAPPAGD